MARSWVSWPSHSLHKKSCTDKPVVMHPLLAKLRLGQVIQLLAFNLPETGSHAEQVACSPMSQWYFSCQNDNNPKE